MVMNDIQPMQMDRSVGLQDKNLDAGEIVSKGCGMCCETNNNTPVLTCLKAIICPCLVVNDSYTQADKCCVTATCGAGVAPQCCCALLEPALIPGFMTSELYHLNAYRKGDCPAFTCAFCCSTCLMASHNNARAKVVSILPADLGDTGAKLLRPPAAPETKPFKW